MKGQRVYIAAADAEKWEKALLRETDFLPVGCENNGQRAIREIRELTPDLLILDGALSVQDGFFVLHELEKTMIAPPRILFLSRMPGEKWLQMAREKGADRAVFWPDSEEMGLRILREMAEEMLPHLAMKTEHMRLELVEELLLKMKVSPRLKGREYMRLAAVSCACAPHLAGGFSKKLYFFLADQFSTTPHAVERAIRTAIENTWLHGDMDGIQALFGFSVDAEKGKPTNAEFLSMLSEHVRREGQKRLLYQNNI